MPHHTHLQGAQNVRCARCSHVTPVPLPPPVSQDAQLHCTGCRTLLMYPRGSLQVQCSICGSLNDAQQSNQLGHVMCGGCNVQLMHAYGAQSVKCAVCNHVTPAAARPPPPPSMPQQQHQQQQQPQPYNRYQQQQQQPPRRPPQQQPPPYYYPQQQQPQAQPPRISAQENKPAPVLVENPPSLDDSGNEVQNVSLGVAPRGQ